MSEREIPAEAVEAAKEAMAGAELKTEHISNAKLREMGLRRCPGCLNRPAPAPATEAIQAGIEAAAPYIAAAAKREAWGEFMKGKWDPLQENPYGEGAGDE